MILGIAHLAYKVKDMDKSLDFYCRGLGFTHAFSIEDDDGNKWIEYLKAPDGRFIELFYPKGDEPAGTGTFMHLCLQTDDCVAEAKRFESLGIDVWAKPKRGKDLNYQCWVSDPDGRPIEIMEYSPESPQANA